MKKSIHVVCVFIFLSTCLMSYGQVYKTAQDTVKLNKEFTEVSNDIANLNAKLIVAQNNLPGYKSKASSADSDAQHAAENSSIQADKATEGDLKEVRKAIRKSKKAYRKAKDARNANNNIGEQDDKIASLTGQLAKKQERLRQLTEMRSAIEAQLFQQ